MYSCYKITCEVLNVVLIYLFTKFMPNYLCSFSAILVAESSERSADCVP